MLVLSRKRDEEIVIGDGAAQVVVTIVEIRGDKVRLGINAPSDVPVHRREVFEAIRRKGLEARGLGLEKNESIPTLTNHRSE